MGTKPTITAERAIFERTEVLLFKRTAERRTHDVLTVVMERAGRGISGAYLCRAMSKRDCDEMVEAACAGEVSQQPRPRAVPLATARRTLGRAVLMSRIADRDVPQWLFTQTDLVGDLHREQGWVEDVYLCTDCEGPLAPDQQVANTRLKSDSTPETQCPACSGDSVVADSTLSHLRARAWVMIAAHEPRRALVYAARAEGAHERGADLDAIKGAAALLLANPVQATHHLRRAVEKDPSHVRAHGLLVDALTRCGMVDAARTALQAMLSAAPQLATHVDTLGLLLDREGPRTDGAIERRCLHALTLLDCGREEEAKALLAPVADDGVLAGPGLRAWDALSNGRPPREIARLATGPVGSGLAHAVKVLHRAM